MVRSVPDDQQLAEIGERFPGTRVKVHVAEGDDLADLLFQDAYSFELADVYLGADTEIELDDRPVRSSSCSASRSADHAGGWSGRQPRHRPMWGRAMHPTCKVLLACGRPGLSMTLIEKVGDNASDLIV